MWLCVSHMNPVPDGRGKGDHWIHSLEKGSGKKDF